MPAPIDGILALPHHVLLLSKHQLLLSLKLQLCLQLCSCHLLLLLAQVCDPLLFCLLRILAKDFLLVAPALELLIDEPHCIICLPQCRSL